MNWDVPAWIQTVVPWGIAILSSGVILFVAKTYKPGERENVLVDQLQEERDAANEGLRLEREAAAALRIEVRTEFESNRAMRQEMREEMEEMRREREAIHEERKLSARRERKLLAYMRDLYQHILSGNPPPPPSPDPEIEALLNAIDK